MGLGKNIFVDMDNVSMYYIKHIGLVGYLKEVSYEAVNKGKIRITGFA